MRYFTQFTQFTHFTHFTHFTRIKSYLNTLYFLVISLHSHHTLHTLHSLHSVHKDKASFIYSDEGYLKKCGNRELCEICELWNFVKCANRETPLPRTISGGAAT